MRSEIWRETRRKIVKIFLDMLILMELRKRSMSGYDILDHVHKKFNILMSSGTIYSHLSSMEINRLIRGEDSPRKRVYTLTKRGKEEIKTFLSLKDKILGLIENLFIEG